VDFDVVVIGGGLSGASFAHFVVRRGRKVLILERDPVPGGSFATRAFTDGFWVELGAHTIYSSYARFIEVLEDLGLAGEIVARSKAPYRMCVGGTLVSLPSRVRLGEAMRHLLGFLMRRPGKAGRSVQEHYSAVLGPGNYQRLVRPALRAVISQEPDDFPAETLLKRRPRNPTYPRSFTLRKGLRSFVEAATRQEGVTLRTGVEAVRLVRAAPGYAVTLAGGEEISAERVCLAAPSPVTAGLLADLDPEGAALLGRTAPAVTVESLGLAAPKTAIGVPVFAFIIAAGEAFSSVVSRDVLPHPARRGCTFHFPSPGPRQEEKVARARDLLGLGQAEVEVAETVHVAPRLTVGHADRVREFEGRLRTHRGLFVVGNYFDGLAIEDCVLRARAEAERL
jgi:protoporphyrinogen oxidase